MGKKFHIIFYDQLFGVRRDSVPIMIRRCWIPQQHPGKTLFHTETTAAFIRRHRIKHVYDEIAEVPRALVKGAEIYIFEPADTPIQIAIDEWAQKCKIVILYMDNPGFMVKSAKYTGRGKTRLWYKFGDFYRIFRKQTGILMKSGEPVGGKWSYDDLNRSKIDDLNIIPKPPDSPLYKILPRDRNGAKKWLQKFIDERLRYFGKYQDAIVRGESGTLLFHSGISALLNVGLLRPLEVVAAIAAAKTTINNIEGFVRQLVWREFMRCVYKHFGKDKLLSMNYFSSRRDVPQEWYSPMPIVITPLADAINRAHRHAYLHHIERLMVVGNAMNLLDVHPVAAYNWFIRVVAIDSYEWVMVGNILMCMFNDGGRVVARKPYLATTNYLLKMSNWKKSEIDEKWSEEIRRQYHKKIKHTKKFWR